MSKRKELTTKNPLLALRKFTPARIGLGHVGHSLPTKALLSFQLDHARARDAVYSALDFSRLADEVSQLGFTPLQLQSQAESKDVYLRQPGLGRKLSPTSAVQWREVAGKSNAPILIALGDGLSPRAIQDNGPGLIAELKAKLGQKLITHIPLIRHARVAIGDEVASLIQAELVLLLIGERPGMSSATNISIYLTYAPKIETTDEARNCISNIGGPGGFSLAEGAEKAAYLAERALKEGRSGLQLKDEQ